MSKLKVSDLVNYPQENFEEVKVILKLCHEITVEYTKVDNLYDIEGLERLKRRLTAQLELLASHYAKTKRFKTGGDYLEETRKRVKAEAISRISDSDSISINQAEKIVYGDDFYSSRIELMEALKSWFIKVEIMFINYKNMLSSIIQSISLVRKDPNYKPIDHD